MNVHETLALREMGRDAWNDWATQVLKSKAQFEQAGVFTLNWFSEAGNEETRLWLKVAAADFSGAHFVDETALDGFIFPGPVDMTGAVFELPVSFAGAEFHLPADFGRARFMADAVFKGTKFQDQAIFDDAVFDGIADFERVEFLKDRNGPLNHGVRFQRTRLMGRADFRSSFYAGSADFSKAQFAGTARFDEARFTGGAILEGAVFSAPAGFNGCQFLETASFKEAQFTGEARFTEASFKGECNLDRSQFWGDVAFREATFEKDASFAEMRVEGASRFRGAKFGAQANFLESRLAGEADFCGSAFYGPAIYRLARFGQGAIWTSCQFLAGADFCGVTVARSASFKDSQFTGEALFREAQFEAPVSFAACSFNATADFSALQSKVAFVLAGADFKSVPGFLEASFHEPPRVDYMAVADPLKRFHRWKESGVRDPRGAFFKLWKVCADPDAPAKFRRLKKLASEAQDQPREQEFFAQELRCRRFWHDKPSGPGIARFWLGWIYGGVANYGRSLLRPFMLWLLSVFVFAFYYLSQRGSEWNVNQPPSDIGQWLGSLISAERFPCVSGSSNRIGEALYFSFRSAFLKLDWSDAAGTRRVFGCLYGVEANGSAIVPLSVSAVALFQAAVSAGLLFMFLLALRNLLKVR
ncbi:MAG: pentapeptide repeat-containing protein [Rhodomicrobium sp.]